MIQSVAHNLAMLIETLAHHASHRPLKGKARSTVWAYSLASVALAALIAVPLGLKLTTHA